MNVFNLQVLDAYLEILSFLLCPSTRMVSLPVQLALHWYDNMDANSLHDWLYPKGYCAKYCVKKSIIIEI